MTISHLNTHVHKRDREYPPFNAKLHDKPPFQLTDGLPNYNQQSSRAYRA